MPTDFEAVSTGEIIEASHISQYAEPVQNIENGAAFFALASGGTDSYAIVSLPQACASGRDGLLGGLNFCR